MGTEKAKLKKCLLKTVVKYKKLCHRDRQCFSVVQCLTHKINPLWSIKAMICLILEAGNMF